MMRRFTQMLTDATEAGRAYQPEILAPLYVDYFRNVLAGNTPPVG